jgi:hypothetical protein
MGSHERIYRILIHVYPKGFRAHYADDLAQSFADLVARDGGRRAWSRTAVDLAVTVPRYRLERIMNTAYSTTVLNLTIAVLAAAGIVSVLTGLYPGAVLIPVAATIAISQRSQLARSIRTPDRQTRRRRLTTATTLAVACVFATTGFVLDLRGEDHWNGGKLMVYNAVFFSTLLGAIVFFIVGLLTPKTPEPPNPISLQA